MKRLIGLVACFVFAVSATMFADTLISTTGQWNAAKTANNNASNPVFWDHVSSDGGHCNVGWLLQGGMGTCQNINTLGTFPKKPLDFLSAAGNKNAGVDFYIKPGSGDKTVFQASIAGFSGDHNQFHDVFGWALVGSSVLHPLFSSAVDGPNQIATFSPGGAFRYYIAVYNVVNQQQWIHFSDADGNFFALFSQDPANPSGPPTFLKNYWVGSEDAHINGDFDYQDMLVQITPIPEPTSLMLLGTGLIGMAGALRRKLGR